MEMSNSLKIDQRKSVPCVNTISPIKKSTNAPKTTSHKRTKSSYLPSSIVIIPNCNYTLSQANSSSLTNNKSLLSPNPILLALPKGEQDVNNPVNKSQEVKTKNSLDKIDPNQEQIINISLKLNKRQRNLSQANWLKILINFEDEDEDEYDIMNRPKAN